MDVESSSSNVSLPDGVNDSPSSVVAEATHSDSQEQLLENENPNLENIVTVSGKKRRLNRRIALAMTRSQEVAPTPIFGKTSKNRNETIDLTVEDDDPTSKWFKQTFEKHSTTKKVLEEKNPFAVPTDIHKNVPKSLKMGQILKKRLEASLSVKRRQGQEQRRQQYLLDNAHLMNEDEEEEEEEEITRKKKKNIKKRRRNDEDDYDSEDDEDYEDKGSEDDKSGSEDSDEEEAKKTVEKIDSSPNLFENHIADNQSRADDEISVNLLDDSFTYDVYNNKYRSGPGSTFSTFESQNQSEEILHDGIVKLPAMSAMEALLSKQDSQDDDFGDILSLCSGKFASVKATQDQFPDTMQMLEERLAEMDGKVEDSTKKDNTDTDDNKESADIFADSTDDDEEEEEQFKKKSNKTFNKTIASDDEEEDDEVVKDSVDCDLPETVPLSSLLEEESTISEETEVKITRRIVVSDGEDDDEEEEAEEDDIEDEEEEDDEVEEEQEQEAVEEEEQEEEDDEPAPTFDDEDDELAIMKKLQYQEYKTKSKKKNFFDDEASLSGDDVGSDVEDEEGDDVYEAEEGDADDVPDSSTIQRQNHQLLMRQENAKEQRALLKLQDRLLADGDLGGVDTNRQFRFKIRQEEEAKILAFSTQNADDNDGIEVLEEDEEESEEKQAERAKMLKFRIEKAEELIMLEEPKGVDDLFERAARLVKTTKEQMTVTVEEIETTSRKAVVKPTLLKKTTLATSIQEVLATGGAVPKQMYVRNYNTSTSTSTTSNGGPMKRGRQSPDSSASKRIRQSKLSVLE